MKILFMGTTSFSNVVLNQLIKDQYDIVAVVTQPDRPFGRKKELKQPDTKILALEHGIKVLQPEVIKDALEDIKALAPDCIITCAYGQIVPKSILDIPVFKSLNVHASLLPKYRGGAPIHKSIMAGDTQTGVTLMFMDVGMDTGDMLAKETVSILEDDTFGDVEFKLKDASIKLIKEALPRYFKGELTAEVQDESQASYAYAIKREEEFVSFKKSGISIYNQIRGLIPWPSSYGVLEGLNIKFHGAQFIKNQHQEPFGKVLKVDQQGVLVAVDGGFILLTSVQPAGKSKMRNEDLANGFGALWKGKVFD